MVINYNIIVNMLSCYKHSNSIALIHLIVGKMPDKDVYGIYACNMNQILYSLEIIITICIFYFLHNCTGMLRHSTKHDVLKIARNVKWSHYTPVFRRDVLWYGDVRPSVRPSGSPSVRPSVTVFRTFLLHALTYWSEILCITLFLCT